MKKMYAFLFLLPTLLPAPASRSTSGSNAVDDSGQQPLTGHFLYVATPGIRNYLGYGGHGLLVFNTASSEKMIELFMQEGRVIRAGDQFGLGRRQATGG